MTRARPVAVVVVLAVALGGLRPAQAQKAPELIARGIEAYRNADFARGLDLFREALARPDATRASAIEAYRYIVSSHVALGDTAAATRALRKLLTLAPDYRFPSGTAPKIVALLEEVRQRQPRIEHRPDRDLELGPPVVVDVRVISLPAGTRVVLYYRYAVEGPYAAMPMRPASKPGHLWAVLPAAPAGVTPQGGRTALEYYVAVEEGNGGEPLATVGEATQPQRVVVAAGASAGAGGAGQRVPLYRRFWPWTLAAVIVVGGVVGGVLAARHGGDTGPGGPTQQATIRFVP